MWSVFHDKQLQYHLIFYSILFGLICFQCDFVQTEDTKLDSNVVVQLFSPIIASQRIMFCQFDNSYTSIQLEDDLNIVFEEVNAPFAIQC